MELAKENAENFTQFAFMRTTNQDGLVFEAKDNFIQIIRTQDFSEVSKIECEFISEQAVLQYTKSGIIAWEGENVFLINSK